MAKIVSVSLDQCFNDLTVDSAWTFIRDNGHVIVVECTGGDLDLGGGWGEEGGQRRRKERGVISFMFQCPETSLVCHKPTHQPTKLVMGTHTQGIKEKRTGELGFSS